MLLTRVIPALLIKDNRLVKGVHFKDHRYVGDPMNAIRIFNAKECDELMLLDIGATEQGGTISLDLIRRVSSECFMPVTVGGGITSVEQAQAMLQAGAEKVSLGTSAFTQPELVTQIADAFGAQSVVVSVDVTRSESGKYQVHVRSGAQATRREAVEYAREMESRGAGEILLNQIHRDGTFSGYDLEILQELSAAVSIPVIALGGAGKLDHFREAVEAGASAVSAGSYFVFHGRRRAVLIKFPTREHIDSTLGHQF